MMEQGCGYVTAIKEVQIKGTILMRLNMRKYQGYIKRIGIFDIFCGDGKNSIGGETILGSPVEIINAIKESGIYQFKPVDFFASDNRQTAVDTLGNLLNREIYPFNLNIIKNPADKQLGFLEGYLRQYKLSHVILVVDPNGPKVLPFEQLNALSVYSKRLDVIINISEIAIKRIKGCSITKDCNWWAGYETFEDILWALKQRYKAGWLRDVVKGDNQKWRLMTLWDWTPPQNPWEAQGLYPIRSRQDIVDILDGRLPNGHVESPSPGRLFA
jgi:hypothetical protein